MVGAMNVQVSSTWVCVEGNEDNVDQRGWYNPQLHEFDIILKYLLHVENAMFYREMSLSGRLAINMVQGPNIILRLVQRRVGDNLQ